MSATTGSRRRRSRARALALAVAGATCAAVALALAGTVAGDPAAGTPTAQPVIGLPASDVHTIGPVSDGAPGELWAYGTLRRSAPATVDGATVPASPGGAGTVLLRHTDADGWQVVQEPLAADGTPLRTFSPLGQLGDGQMTADGAGALLGNVTDAAGQPHATLLVRDPGASFRAAPDPGSDVIGDGESIFDAGRRSLAAVDEPGGKGGALIAIKSTPGSPETAVAHFDGSAWTREQVVLPPDLTGKPFRIVALAAASLDDAWLLGQPDATSSRGIVLFQRVLDGGVARWVERPLGGSPFAQSAPPGTGVNGIAALVQPAQALTVTAAGVWIDGAFSYQGAPHSFTLYYDVHAAAITGSWCDGPASDVCASPLGVTLSKAAGYRSYAWPGDGFGTRAITNGLPAGAGDDAANGAYLAFSGSAFQRVLGIGVGSPDGAFLSATEGWIVASSATATLVHFTAAPDPDRIQTWPVPFRRPLLAITGEPGRPPGAPDAQALAVGVNGTIARYLPGQGWTPEFALAGSGARATPQLRGVAWPAADVAYAVGDNGEMWRWRQVTGFWQPDPGRPLDFSGNLMAIAFQPGNPRRGYAVGRQGVLLRYDKTWTQEALPPEVADCDLTSIAFAGGEALVAYRSPAGERSGLLVNDGSGWRVDAPAAALLGDGMSLYAVAGTPDGGAVAAGSGIVLERDGPGAPWRRSALPLPSDAVVAAAVLRDGAAVRALVSVTITGGGTPFPTRTIVPPSGPGDSPQLLDPYELPDNGYLLRETAGGWRDEQHAAYIASPKLADWPIRPDEVLALLIDPASGSGWAVGGEVGGPGATPAKSPHATVQTAGVLRYPATGTTPPQGGSAPVPLAAGPVRFAIGGHAACAGPCSDAANVDIAPDRGLQAALADVSRLAGRPGGPRAFLYTGTRIDGGVLGDADAQRLAQLAEAGGVPFYAAPSADEHSAGFGPFERAFGSFPAPFGDGTAAGDVDMPSVLTGVEPHDGARTHYAFDSLGPEGTVRIIVIDNAAGSLARSDAQQNPNEPQLPWLLHVLDDAKESGIPAIVVGQRDLDSTGAGGGTPASDGASLSTALVAHGASAYFFDSPTLNITRAVPAGANAAIPEFGTGTLGYAGGFLGSTSAFYGDAGFLLAEIDAAHRDPDTNVAPVSVRLVPVIDDLALDANDGVLLRRSAPALFQALARRPRMGRRNDGNGGAIASPEPYIQIPSSPCVALACPGRIPPEYTFSSSDPDIGDFVAHDPSSSNPRAVKLGSDGKPVHDASSGIFCAYNAGTTTATVSAGGLAYSVRVTVLAGTAQRPCGTTPLSPGRFKSNQPTVDVPAIEEPTPTPNAPLSPAVKVPVHLQPAPSAPQPAPQAPPHPPAPIVSVPLVSVPAPPHPVPVVPPPPTPVAQPTPPSGTSQVQASSPVSQSAYAPDRQREEQVAIQQVHHMAAYHPDDRGLPPAVLIGLIVLAAAAGSGLRRSASRGRRPARAYALARRGQPRRRR